MKTAAFLSMMIFLSTLQRPISGDSRPVILAFGDSLTAGYGVQRGGGYPEQLQKRLDSLGYKYRVVNMGVSGDTSSGGLARMKDAVGVKPAIVILD
jgi:acyl-CoA thioesterase I